MVHTTQFAGIVIFAGIEVKEIGTMIPVLLPRVHHICTVAKKKKHKEHFDEIKERKKELKDTNREIDNTVLEKKNLDAFQSKSISAFSTAITPRLLKAFGDKYSPRTATGKLELQRDIATLRIACNNQIPPQSENDSDLFSSLLGKQIEYMGINQSASVCSGKTYNYARNTINKVNTNVFNVSPVQTSRRNRTNKRQRQSETSQTKTL